jgi:signal transduction histidine kinase
MTGTLPTRGCNPGPVPAEVDRLLHDLGQPLAAIRALTWTPPGVTAGDPAARLERIAELAEWMDDLLHLVRTDAPPDPARPGPAEGSGPPGCGVEVGAVLREVVVAAAAGWDGVLRLQPGPPVAVPVPPFDLRRAVANLVDNAIRAGDRVDVRLLPVADRVRIEVTDDGPGFGRLPRQTGHGLAVALEVAARCGGLLEIGAGPAGGAAVRLELPAIAAAGSG